MADWNKILFSICAALAITSFVTDVLNLLPELASDLLAMLAVAAGGTPIIVSGITALVRRDLDVDFLASIAIIAAVIVGEYFAAALVAMMLSGGQILEDYTAGKTSRAIQLLIDSAPQTARIRKDGREMEVPVDDVKVGDVVLVKPGEKIPVDGEIIKGSASVNQASITGESMAVERTGQDKVLSGSIVELGALEIIAEEVGEDTTYAQIIRLIREGQANRAPIEKIADRYARWFAPVLLTIAGISFLITRNVIAAVSTLVIACPCALTLATPTAVVASIGNAARRGILIRGGAALETVGNTDTVVLDKTGTLTLGSPKVVEIRGFNGKSEEQVMMLAALAEKFSEHHLAKSVLEKASELGITAPDPSRFSVLPGLGVIVQYQGREVLAGNENLLEAQHIELESAVKDGLEAQKRLGRTIFIVCEDKTVAGLVSVADVARGGVADAIAELRSMGVKKVAMLTGDNLATANAIARQVGIGDVAAELLPEEKVDYVKGLKEKGESVLMVGDGINDAPALAAAHVGVAMGKTGTDVAIETADVVLISDDFGRLPRIVRTGQKTIRLIRQNIYFAMAVNIVGIALAASGEINPVVAAAIHEGNALFVVMNSARLIWA